MKGLICDVCRTAAPLQECDGWLSLSRIDIDPNEVANPLGSLMAMVRIPLDEDGVPEFPEPPPVPLTADPMRAANAEVCSTECGIRFLEARRIWEQALVEEEALDQDGADDPS